MHQRARRSAQPLGGILDRNPYAPPKADPGTAGSPVLANTPAGGLRSPGEYVLLASLAGSWVFWAYLWTLGTIEFRESRAGAIALLLCFLGVAAISFWLILRRRLVGAALCSLFYGVQLVSATLPSGENVGFNSLPTINIRIFGDDASPVNLNLVALILFVLSLVLCAAYRQRRVDAA